MRLQPNRGLHWFACLTAFATFILIVAGASVTSNRAGLAVPDWPTSYGHFMFSYPFSKMVGGIFYEHGHRLIASTVGILTIILAIWLVRKESRAWVRRLGIVALAAVIAQGVLGGLTVKHLLPAPVSIAHAGLAQAFFCLTMALAMVTSPRWFEPATVVSRARSLQRFALATTITVYAQLILGATIRHADRAVTAHVVGAVLVLLCAGIAAMATAPSVRRKDLAGPAVVLVILVLAQLWIGAAALAVRAPKFDPGPFTTAQIVLPTLHLAIGALILAASFTLTLKTFRHLKPAEAQRALPWPAYLELIKPRIVSMVLVTTTLGFVLGGHGTGTWPVLLATLLGVGCATAGAAVLNNYLERDVDSQMARTRHRALPAGLVEPATALGLGVCLVLAGVFVLVRGVNLLTGFLVLLGAFLYVLVYTPMKRLTWLNTTIGAIPGAIPPLCGWSAAAGRLEPGAWVLFAILFAWQHPHFFAIAWMFRDDYRNAGLKMLPVVEPTGRTTFRQTLFFSVLLVAASVVPAAMGLAGRTYLYGALVLGASILVAAGLFTVLKTFADARRLLKVSIVYLPLLVGLMIFDRL
jgi:protoheme IX farnesyltransferase